MLWALARALAIVCAAVLSPGSFLAANHILNTRI